MHQIAWVRTKLAALTLPLRTRLADIAREQRIQHHGTMALLALRHGHKQAAIVHGSNMFEEMRQRSPQQVARLQRARALAAARKWNSAKSWEELMSQVRRG